MPPKAKYSREAIGETAYKMVRKHGESFLTARSLAAELGTSTAPIFTAFSGIEEVQRFVTEKAATLFRSYLEAGLAQALPFKGAGLEYIRFAKEEPELFKLLFMQGSESAQPTHYLPTHFAYEPDVRGAVASFHGLNERQAKRLYNHLSVYAHGLAVLFAQRQCVFTMEDAERMLSEVFLALKKEENNG